MFYLTPYFHFFSLFQSNTTLNISGILEIFLVMLVFGDWIDNSDFLLRIYPQE